MQRNAMRRDGTRRYLLAEILSQHGGKEKCSRNLPISQTSSTFLKTSSCHQPKRRHSRKTAVRHPHAMPFSSHRCGQAPNLPAPKTSPEQAPRTKTSPQSGTTSVTSKPCNPYLPPTSSLSPRRNLHIHPSIQPPFY